MRRETADVDFLILCPVCNEPCWVLGAETTTCIENTSVMWQPKDSNFTVECDECCHIFTVQSHLTVVVVKY